MSIIFLLCYNYFMKDYEINEITYKRVLGRALVNDGSLSAFWAGDGLELNVKASEVWVKLCADYGSNEIWVAVKINGATTQRFPVLKEEQWVKVACKLNSEKGNTVQIIKDTQPMPGDGESLLKISEVRVDDNASFEIPVKRNLFIEFIGDSITSGEGLFGGRDEMDWIPTWISVNNNFAMQIVRELNADYSLVSQCGWGVCYAYDGNASNNVPSLYEKADFNHSYDFGKKVDVVVLNLGTNDNSALSVPGVEAEKITLAVTTFLKTIRKHNPEAKIVWTWGMLKLDKAPKFIKAGIDEYKKQTGDKEIYTLKLKPMHKVEKNPEDFGSRCHPGPKTHLLAAKKITAFLQNLLK